MSIHLLPPPAAGRQLRPESEAVVDDLRTFYRKLKHEMELELDRAEICYGRCYSLQQAILELQTIFPMLKEEDE